MKKKKGLHDEITRVAYELYETRDRAHGCEVADWLAAEKIVMEKHARHAKGTEQEIEKGFPATVTKSWQASKEAGKKPDISGSS